MASRVALIAASVSLASSAPPPPALWGQSLLGTPGRSGQGSLNGPVPSTEWAGAAHLVDVKWRWALPRDTASSFFYGGIDASGDVYYSDTGNGAGPTVVYKIRGDTGVTNWKSDQLPRPTYGNFYGNDHLIVGPGRDPGIFVVAGTTYTLADCAWVTRLDAKTGAPTWWINGTGGSGGIEGRGTPLAQHRSVPLGPQRRSGTRSCPATARRSTCTFTTRAWPPSMPPRGGSARSGTSEARGSWPTSRTRRVSSRRRQARWTCSSLRPRETTRPCGPTRGPSSGPLRPPSREPGRGEGGGGRQ